jgi:short-subunit dehydrogenase
MDIKGKVAIVTGASGGIGYATAKLLSSKGAKLALVARSQNKLEQLAKELPNSIAIPADISKVEDIKRMIKQTCDHFGRVDILVNNAGQGYDAPIEKIDVDVFRGIFELDFLGPVVAMQQVIPIMRKHGGGAIMNVSSGLALMYLPGMSIYASLKRALSHISLTAREELKADKIVVSVVYPYITVTDFEKNTVKASERNWENDEEGDEGGAPFKADTAEYVAQKIVEGIESGEAEVFVHDWMKTAPAS